MFEELFNSFADLIGSKIKEAAKEVAKRLAVPEAEEPFVLVRRFIAADTTLSKGGITATAEGWQIEAYDDGAMRLNTSEPLRQVTLFEISEPEESERVLLCRFQAKALNSKAPISVQIGLSKQQQLLTNTRAWGVDVAQSDTFKAFEVRAHFKKETAPAKVQIMVVFKSSGLLQIKNIELLQAPVKSPPA
jgi:hypothetical protein